MEQYNLKQLAADWTWLIDLENFELLTISPFGDLFLRDQSGLCVLDINGGCLEYATADGDDPVNLFPELFDGRIARGYQNAQLFVKPGTCYGYKIQTVTGGSFDVENVYIATLTEYISFMGCFHFQVKDVPDGESVVINVVRPKPN